MFYVIRHRIFYCPNSIIITSRIINSLLIINNIASTYRTRMMYTNCGFIYTLFVIYNVFGSDVVDFETSQSPKHKFKFLEEKIPNIFKINCTL